ncbi:MAG: hypothetical protein FWD46_04325 [Cystobacterineae bacterium]|nr:hypothetical protein [Cystobacterineae bacterium]
MQIFGTQLTFFECTGVNLRSKTSQTAQQEQNDKKADGHAPNLKELKRSCNPPKHDWKILFLKYTQWACEQPF